MTTDRPKGNESGRGIQATGGGPRSGTGFKPVLMKLHGLETHAASGLPTCDSKQLSNPPLGLGNRSRHVPNSRGWLSTPRHRLPNPHGRLLSRRWRLGTRRWGVPHPCRRLGHPSRRLLNPSRRGVHPPRRPGNPPRGLGHPSRRGRVIGTGGGGARPGEGS